MAINRHNLRQVEADTDVPYSTLRAWQKSRPGLIEYINVSVDNISMIAILNTEIARLKAKLIKASEYLRE